MENTLLFVQTPATVHRKKSSSAEPAVKRYGCTGSKRVTVVAMSGPSTYEEYMKSRDAGLYHGGKTEDAQKALQSFIDGGGDMEFDGGDSGGGVVGDGNVDLEDQHNTSSFIERPKKNDGRSAVEARKMSAGGNYFGRTTGYAEQKIKEITEEDRKHHRLDEVRAQQLENWHNQRAMHAANQQRQTIGGGGSYVPFQSVLSNKAAQQKQNSDRRDGKDWGPVAFDPSQQPTEIFELQTNPNKTQVVEFSVSNPYMGYAPFRCAFSADSDSAYEVTPAGGMMNRSSGEPIQVVVRFTPVDIGRAYNATLIFETEDFKNIYRFIGST